jgi:Flp pilus assembly protein TadD
MLDIPPEAAPAFSEALADYGRGLPAKAAAGFASVLLIAADHPDVLRLYGLALTRTGKAREALPFLARARRLAWDQPLAHLHHGIGLLEAGMSARAAAVLRRAASMNPDDPAVWVNFSAALLAVNQAPAARAAARRALKAAPALADALYAFGVASLGCGSPVDAVSAFEHAVQLRPDFAQAWLSLGLAYYRTGSIARAKNAMHKTLQVDPGNAEAGANLAAFLLLGGATDAAFALLRDVLARAPDCVAARINLANTLLLEREPAKALALLAGPPPGGRAGLHWRAHRVLALMEMGQCDQAHTELEVIAPPWGDAEILLLWRHIAFASPDEVPKLVGRMTAAVADETMLPEHRIIGHFDLAAFHARRGMKQEAFAHWIDGHKLLRQFQPFSRSAFSEFIETSITTFDAKRLAGDRAANDDAAPVFIVGMPRSGTTLAEQILAAHPKVFGAGERPAIHQMIVDLAGGAETAESARRLGTLNAAALTNAANEFLADLHALAPNASRIVDKMPANARHLGFLAVFLPRARFILCERDPRDVGLSIFQFRFFGHHPYAHDLGDLGFAIREQQRLMTHWRAVLGPRLMQVELSNWADDFSGTLRRVLEFVGLPYDATCERFYEETRHVRTASASQVRRPVNRDGIGRYRAYAEFLEPLFAELDGGSTQEPGG